MNNMELISMTIDNGGSELRVLPVDRAEDTEVTDAILRYPSTFCRIPNDSFRIKDVSNPEEVIQIFEAPDPAYCGYYATGLSGNAYGGSTLLALNPRDRKSTSKNFYLQFIYDITQGIINDNRMKPCMQENADEYTIASLPVDWLAVVGTNIPISEHQSDKDFIKTFKDSVCGDYKISYPLLKGSPVINLHIDSNYIGILPEGGVVLASLASSVSDDQYTLVVDIGRVSDDIAIFLGTKLIGISAVSGTNAGATLLTLISQELEAAGYRVNMTMCANAAATGEIKMAGSYVDVKEYVKRAQRNYVINYLRQDLDTAFQRANCVPAQMDNIVAVGAPMNSVPGLEYLPELILKDLDIPKVNILCNTTDTRYANIVACEKFTKALTRKARKELSASFSNADVV